MDVRMDQVGVQPPGKTYERGQVDEPPGAGAV
jgi:hypothetical protein